MVQVQRLAIATACVVMALILSACGSDKASKSAGGRARDVSPVPSVPGNAQSPVAPDLSTPPEGGPPGKNGEQGEPLSEIVIIGGGNTPSCNFNGNVYSVFVPLPSPSAVPLPAGTGTNQTIWWNAWLSYYDFGQRQWSWAKYGDGSYIQAGWVSSNLSFGNPMWFTSRQDEVQTWTTPTLNPGYYSVYTSVYYESTGRYSGGWVPQFSSPSRSAAWCYFPS